MKRLRTSTPLLIFFSLALLSIPFPDYQYDLELSDCSKYESSETPDLGLQTGFEVNARGSFFLAAFIGIHFPNIPAFISLAQSNRASPLRSI
jgi:hypothetical protein